MRLIKYIGVVVTLGVIAAGCITEFSEPITATRNGREVIVSASQELTRAYVSEVDTSVGTSSYLWDEGDAIGVFVSGPTTETNAKFTSVSGADVEKAAFKGTFLSEEASGIHTYYAYSPYNASAGSNLNALSGTLSATQVQTSTKGTHIGANMLELAKTEAEGNNGAALEFRNMFSVLNFKIKYRAKGVDGETEDLSNAIVSNVRIFAAEDSESTTPLYGTDFCFAGDYTFDLENQSVTMNSASYSWVVDCKLTGDNVVTSTTNDGALDVWVVVNPINLGTNKLVAEIVTDKGTFHTTRSIKSNNGQLMPNTVYVLPATIKTPKVVPQAYPLWTEGEGFFSTLSLDGTVANADSAIELKPANSFMVQPNTLYKFNANIRGRGAQGVAAMGITSDDIIGDYAINADGSLTSVLGNDNWIYFQTSTAGNGVISLYFGSTAIWSWHVWSVEDAPTSIQVTDDIYVLDRNLGATLVAPSNTKTGNFYYYSVKAAGLYYCWGYNVPFPGMPFGSSYNGTPTKSQELLDIYYYNGTSTAQNVTSRYNVPAAGLSASLMQPHTPANLRNNSEINAATDNYSAMWGYKDGSYEKSAFDPCPYGYRVPSSDELDAMTIADVINRCTPIVYDGTNATYLPKMGIVGLMTDNNVWQIQSIGAGFYWSATPAEVSQNGGSITTTTWNQETGKFESNFQNECNNSRAMSHYYQSGTTHFAFAISRFQGAPVRCVKYDAESGSATK